MSQTTQNNYYLDEAKDKLDRIALEIQQLQNEYDSLSSWTFSSAKQRFEITKRLCWLVYCYKVDMKSLIELRDELEEKKRMSYHAIV